MYARILVALDGSEIANRALWEALHLAKEGHAQVRLVRVEDVIPPASTEVYVDFEEYRQACLKEGQEILDHAVAAARQEGIVVESTLIEIGSSRVGDGVVDEAKRWAADLIVLGTHGRSGLRHLLLGSVAEGVVRKAPVPVLLVRGTETAQGAD